MGNRTARILSALLFLSVSLIFNAQVFADDLLLTSFESATKSDLGTEMGTWTSNPLDSSQGTTMETIDVYGVMGRTGSTHVAKITYDVATNGPALNGIYIMLNKMNLAPYKNLTFLIKGDPDKGFTTKFSVTLTSSSGQRATCRVTGITDNWQKISIPVKKFLATGTMGNLSNIVELDVTFDDMTVDAKEGVLYMDEIRLTTD